MYYFLMLVPDIVLLRSGSRWVGEQGRVGEYIGDFQHIILNVNTRAKKWKWVGRGAGRGEGSGDFQDSI